MWDLNRQMVLHVNRLQAIKEKDLQMFPCKRLELIYKETQEMIQDLLKDDTGDRIWWLTRCKECERRCQRWWQLLVATQKPSLADLKKCNKFGEANKIRRDLRTQPALLMDKTTSALNYIPEEHLGAPWDAAMPTQPEVLGEHMFLQHPSVSNTSLECGSKTELCAYSLAAYGG